jgi:LacI family transcriptional regulator
MPAATFKKISSSPRRPFVGIVADGTFRYGRDIVRGATQYANAHRQWELYGVLRRLSDGSVQWPSCDGAIIGNVTPGVFDVICAKSRHVISCSGSTDPALMPTVSLDDMAVGRLAADHLLESGLKTFSFYGVPGKRASDNRDLGFSTVVGKLGYTRIRCPFAFSGWTDLETAEPWNELSEWLQSLPKPIGIMAVDDMAAGYLAAACRHADVVVPEQVAIIGVNNDEIFCETASAPISSVDAGFTRVGYAAAVMLDRLFKGEKLTQSQQHVRFAPLGIIKRLSTDAFAIDDPQLADAVRYIREHACDPCSVANVARSTATGRRSLERRFTQRFGRTPGDEILRVQMETAKRLLIQPDLYIAEVAERCGFAGFSAFSPRILQSESANSF